MRQLCDRLLMLALIALVIPTLGMVCSKTTPDTLHPEILNKKGAVEATGIKVESGAVKGVDLGQLKEIQARLDAQAKDISGLKSSIKTGNITTGGTTHIVLLVLGLALIGAYFHGRYDHSQNKKEIKVLKSAINPLRTDELAKEASDMKFLRAVLSLVVGLFKRPDTAIAVVNDLAGFLAVILPLWAKYKAVAKQAVADAQAVKAGGDAAFEAAYDDLAPVMKSDNPEVPERHINALIEIAHVNASDPPPADVRPVTASDVK